MAGCCNNIKDYTGTTPVMAFDKFFNGPVRGHGVVYGRNTAVLERFDVDMHTTWHGDKGVLKEDFVYYSGRKQHREWNIVKTGPDTFTATAADIIGTAHGTQNGTAINWKYVMAVETKGRTINLSMDDWMYQMNDGTVMNRVTMRKFGIRVGEVNVVMQRR